MDFKKFFKSLFKIDKSNDPIKNLPLRSIEKIFSYCRGSDLMNFSLVNKRWYKCIAKSPACMDKIKIFMTEPKIGCYQLFTMSDAVVLIQGGRRYTHILITNIERSMLTQHKLLLAYFKWKSVAIHNHSFRTKMELINFLGIVEPHVEELILRTVKHGRSMHEIGDTNFSFPKLQKLTLSNCYTYVYVEPFLQIQSLEQFSIATEVIPFYRYDRGLVDRIKSIQYMILRNRGIKFLELFINQHDFDSMFMDQRFLSRIEFRLEALFVGRFQRMDSDSEDINVVQIHNFLNFLKSQEKTLVVFYMEKWLGNDVFEFAINELKLQQLTIENLDLSGSRDESVANLSLFSNETIEKISIWTNSMRYNDIIAETLKVCRSLRMLELRTINQKILDTMVEFNHELEFIVTDNFTAYMPPERAVLRKLKKMIIQVHCADNFRDLVGGRGDYTNFETAFLYAAKSLRRRWDVNNSSLCRQRF